MEAAMETAMGVVAATLLPAQIHSVHCALALLRCWGQLCCPWSERVLEGRKM